MFIVDQCNTWDKFVSNLMNIKYSNTILHIIINALKHCINIIEPLFKQCLANLESCQFIRTILGL
jgi:hypothetical protein